MKPWCQDLQEFLLKQAGGFMGRCEKSKKPRKNEAFYNNVSC